MIVSGHAFEVDLQDENLVSEPIKNGDPRFVTAFVPTVTAISKPALWTDEEARREMADAREGLKYLSPVPDELNDDTPPNQALMEKYGDKLPLKLDFPLRGINQEWEIWVDVIGRWFYLNTNTGEMKWDLGQDLLVNPVLQRQSDTAELKGAFSVPVKDARYCAVS